MKKKFEEWHPSRKSQELLAKISAVLEEMYAQGYVLSLRQLHYQLVSRDITPNTQQSYDNLGALLTKARMAGLIDWDYIEDRHREVTVPPTWSSPSSILNSAAQSYRINKWAEQEYYVEVWIEKDALSGVVEPVCLEEQVNFLACKGYMSASSKYGARERMLSAIGKGQQPIIIYLGDHDPSGLDMPRNIKEDMEMMTDSYIKVDRIGLTMAQIREYNPPPNFAKETDVRWPAYRELYGEYSWEVDALPPSYLQQIVRNAITGYRDDEAYQRYVKIEEQQKAHLFTLARNWKGG